MSKKTITVANVKFNVGNRKVEFKIYHNMPEVFGLSFECALHNWINRTSKYTDEDLVRYIRDKGTGHLVFTEKQFKAYSKDEREKSS